MPNIPTLYKIYISSVIAIGIALVIQISSSEKINIADLQFRQGVIEKFQCIESRSTLGLDLIVNYSGVSQDEFVTLPLSTNCESIPSDIIGTELLVSYHKNINFGFSIDGKFIKTTESELSAFNDKTDGIMFVLFMMFISVILLYFKSRHSV